MKHQFIYNDGGRETAGFKGNTSDCVCRSIAIATELPYKEVYDLINEMSQSERTGKRKRGKSSARAGVYKQTIHKIMKHLGWTWIPTMKIGQGCKVHLHPNELPSDRLVVSVSKHTTAVIDGIIHDTGDPRRIWSAPYNGEPLKSNQWVTKQNNMIHTETRCVYGYWEKQ